jgi:pimeloyl-ACP methyl ester carboxylesterase
VFIVRPLLVVIPLLVVAVPLVAGAMIMRSLIGGCFHINPADAGLTFEQVTFPSESSTSFQGYFVPGAEPRTGVTIISIFLNAHEIAAYQRHGYNVFLYDPLACAGQPNTLGNLEVNQAGDALNYLATRSDVDASKFAVAGFSYGGATALMAGARYPQLKAVQAEGGYADFADEVRDYSGGWWFSGLFDLGARMSYRFTTGQDLTTLSPISVISQIAPRPIFLIYGTSDPALPGAYQEQETAGANASLWVVEGSGHGGYVWVAPEEYERRVVAFMDQSFGITH